MKSIINLPIPAGANIVVKAGDKVNTKTVIAKLSIASSSDTIHIAKLLSVGNNKILKFLKKKIGDELSEGDIIAQKKGLFSKVAVRSPIKGKIGEADLALGTLQIYAETKKEEEELLSPISGSIADVGKTFIAIEAENPIFKAEKAEGKETKGELRFLDKEKVGILDQYEDMENAIVLCRALDDATAVKFSVLGVNGLIMLRAQKETDLPCMVVSEDVFEKLVGMDGKKIWLRPKEKEIVVLG